MYLNSKPEFKHCILFAANVKNEKYVQLQTSLSLGKKKFSFGKENTENYNKAIKAGYEIDDYIDRCMAKKESIDLARLKQIAKSISKPHLKIVESPKVKAIWQDYVKFHLALDVWSESYINTHIARISNFISREDFPDSLDKPSKCLEWFLEGKRSTRTAKDRFKLVVAAVDWGSKNDRIDRKYGIRWRDCLSTLNSTLKNEKKSTVATAVDGEEEKIDPFTLEEIRLILDALKTESFSRYKGRHYQYYHYVKFLWLSGCRPSEAIALKWENVNLAKHKLKFCEAEVMASGVRCVRKGTKTEPFRFFPVNQGLEDHLKDCPTYKENQGYVFLSLDNNPITQHNLNRIWQSLLPKLGIRYRIPYQLRHTMISYHANRGMPLAQLASIVGNSEKVISDHYLKIDISLINVPLI